MNQLREQTAKEFLEQRNGGKDLLISTEHGDLMTPIFASLLMEEYAKLEAEAFAEWIDKYQWFIHIGEWICLGSEEAFTTSELYQKFCKQRKENQ